MFAGQTVTGAIVKLANEKAVLGATVVENKSDADDKHAIHVAKNKEQDGRLTIIETKM